MSVYVPSKRAMLCKPEEIGDLAWANASRFLRAIVNEQGQGQVLLEREQPKGLVPPDSLADYDSTEALIPGPYVSDVGLELPESFRAMNDMLVAKGHHPLSPWWERVFARIYMFPRGRIVIRVGRRGGKTSSLARYAAHEILYGRFEAPKGDKLVYPIVCQNKITAGENLGKLADVFRDLGMKDMMAVTASEIRFEDLKKTIRVTTCSASAVVGITCMGGIGDEVTRWMDHEGRSNAVEVIRAWGPGLLTMSRQGARLALISSPVGTNDVHATYYVLGTTDHQLVAYAPTWVANPSEQTTKEATRILEADEQVWLREFGAIPMAVGLHQFFPDELIEQAKKGFGS